jgi:hypothetical protein
MRLGDLLLGQALHKIAARLQSLAMIMALGAFESLASKHEM